MKLSQSQLRQLIREAIAKKTIKEGRLKNPIVDLVGGALAHQVNEMFEREGGTLESNAFEMVMGTPDPDVMIPSRYEDVMEYARACAEVAVMDLQNQLEEIASGILQELMEPVES